MKFGHRSTDKLSAKAQRVMLAGFAGKKTARAVSRDIWRKAGERVNERTVARRAHEWRAQQLWRQDLFEQARAVVAAMKAENWSASDVVTALATNALLSDPQGFTGSPALRVQTLNLRGEQLGLRREEIELRRRTLALEIERAARGEGTAPSKVVVEWIDRKN